MSHFSWRRMLAVFIKEFQQMLRDRLTFGMAVGVPIMQLVLFGYAINTDPKGLPTAIVSSDPGPMSRGVLAALQNTGYYRIDYVLRNEAEGEALVASGRVQFRRPSRTICRARCSTSTRARRPLKSGCTAATTRRGCRATTSCPGWSVPFSP